MEAAGSSKMLVPNYPTALQCTSEDTSSTATATRTRLMYLSYWYKVSSSMSDNTIIILTVQGVSDVNNYCTRYYLQNYIKLTETLSVTNGLCTFLNSNTF